MTFLFKIHRADGVDPVAFNVAFEKARRAWRLGRRIYPGTLYEHLKAGDFDHLLPPNFYYLEDFSHKEKDLPPEFWEKSDRFRERLN